MKKNILKAGIIALAINVIGLLINLFSALCANTLLLAFPFHGGEISEYSGFGLTLTKYYPLALEGESKTTSKLSFDFRTFLITFVILFAIILIALIIDDKLIKKNKK